MKPLASLAKGGATAKNIAEFLLKKSFMKKENHEVEKVATARLSSPTSVSMRNTFIIKNADESFDYNSRLLPKGSKKATSTWQDAKFTSLEKGQRPTPRDGHSACVDSSGCMYIFGGDRHHMPFNDLYMIQLN